MKMAETIKKNHLLGSRRLARLKFHHFLPVRLFRGGINGETDVAELPHGLFSVKSGMGALETSS